MGKSVVGGKHGGQVAGVLLPPAPTHNRNRTGKGEHSVAKLGFGINCRVVGWAAMARVRGWGGGWLHPPLSILPARHAAEAHRPPHLDTQQQAAAHQRTGSR